MRKRNDLRRIGRSESYSSAYGRADRDGNGNAGTETITLDAGGLRRPELTIYCDDCHGRRAVADWRERGDVLLVDLEPCHHTARVTARLEWLPYSSPERARLRARSA